MGTVRSNLSALASTIISQLAESPWALFAALLPNIVLSFPAVAQLTRAVKIGRHLEPLKEKKVSGIPVLEMDPELLTQKNLAAISKARSSSAAGLVPIVH